MPQPATIDGDLTLSGRLRATAIEGALARSNLVQTESAVYALPLENFRVWDAYHTTLPTIGAADDLGLATGTFGTDLPYLKTQDMNAANAVTEYARTMFTLPPEYTAGSTIYLRLAAGMLSAVASVSATVDAEVYVSARNTHKTGSDLVTTSAQSCNSTTYSELTFTLTSTSLIAGSVLDIRLTFALNSATASSHFGFISHAELLLPIKG